MANIACGRTLLRADLYRAMVASLTGVSTRGRRCRDYQGIWYSTIEGRVYRFEFGARTAN